MLSRPLKQLLLVALFGCIFFLFIPAQTLVGSQDSSLSGLQRQFVKTYLQAERGDSDAQYRVGMMYYSGQDLPRDTTLAVLWFTKAAGQGNPDAQYFLSLIYGLGDGVSQDDKLAAKWCRKAAEQGHTDAQYSLGRMYSMGTGLMQDHSQALLWLTKAAEQDHLDASCDLGLMYSSGKGIIRDVNQAIQWWTKAAEQGHAWSGLLLQEALQAGPESFISDAIDEEIDQLIHSIGIDLGVVEPDEFINVSKQEPDTSQDILNQAESPIVPNSGNRKQISDMLNPALPPTEIEIVDPIADGVIQEQMMDASVQYDLAIEIYEGQEEERDYDRAFRLFKASAEQGHPQAQYKLGVMYSFGHGTIQDSSAAASWFQKSADQGLPAAQYSLGVMYATGQGVVMDPVTAAQWYTRAAEQGSVAAQFMLGVIYSKGQGVTRDSESAVRWYTKAAEQGSPAAQYLLGALYEEGRGVVVKNDKESVKWYTKAAYRGHGEAQYSLAIRYMKGQGVDKDDIRAYMWFLIAGVNGKKVDRYEQVLEAKMPSDHLEQSRRLAREILERINQNTTLESDRPTGLLNTVKPNNNPSP